MFQSLAGLYIDKHNRIFTSEQYPGRVQMFRYFTDDEARAELARRKAEDEKKNASGVKTSAAASATPQRQRVLRHRSRNRVWTSADGQKEHGLITGSALIAVAVDVTAVTNQEVLNDFMRKMMLVLFVVLLAVGLAAAQTYTKGAGLTGIDVLGAHNNGGRGCAGCHAPHSGAAGGGGNAITGGATSDAKSGSNALFGQDVSPLFGQTLAFGLDGNGGAGYVEVLPSQAAAYSTNEEELRGIMMCLACHDGQIAKGQMMAGVSWEKANNLLPAGVYGPNGIPTLLGTQ